MRSNASNSNDADTGIRDRLRDGRVVFGTLSFEFHTFGLLDVLGHVGADFVVIDLEASALSMNRLGGILRVGRRSSVSPWVRVPEIDKAYVSRCLDIGAQGIMAPMVDTPEQARRLVSLAMYPPKGSRGAAFAIGHDDYGAHEPGCAMALANATTVLIAQIESAEGVVNAQRIAEVDGIDALWIGHNDLLNSLGLPNDRTHPLFLEAVSKVRDACATTGVALAGVASSPADVLEMLKDGYRCISLMSDVRLMQHGFSACAKAANEFLSTGTVE